MKFKLFPNEHYDQQREKHNAYMEAGFELFNQEQEKDGMVIREYKKGSEKRAELIGEGEI